MEMLHLNGIEYNTYGDKNTKRKSYIVRGLLHGQDDANIRAITESLIEFNITGVSGITRFMTPHMKRLNFFQK